jgi:CHAD domain-containing protein
VTIEREVKLAVPPGFVLPDLDGEIQGLSARPEPSRQMRTTYFDTPDLRVARWGCSLRHRSDEGWTVKLPAVSQVKLPAGSQGKLLVRDEHTFPGSASRPAPEAVDLLLAYLRTQEVAPVARLRTVRQRTELRDPIGELVGEVVDDEVSVMSGRKVADRFREIEVEARDGLTDELLEQVLARLREAGAGEAQTPKHLRALGPRASDPPELVESPLDSNPTVADVLRLALVRSVVRLLRHDAGVRLGEDPEAVHQARVATRRVRSDLRTYRDVLDPEWATPLRDELKWLAAELGNVRDAEVLGTRLREIAQQLRQPDATQAGKLIARLESRRDDARSELLAAMRDKRYLALLDEVVEAAKRPRLLEEAARPAKEVLPVIMTTAWGKLSDAVGESSDHPTNEELHGVRIQTKRVRYAAESMIPVFGKPADRFAERAADLQDVLGEHQDAVVAGEWLRDAAGRGAKTAFVAGQLAELERQRTLRARAEWPGGWKKLSRKRTRFWT